MNCFLLEAAPTAKPVVIYESQSEANVSTGGTPLGEFRVDEVHVGIRVVVTCIPNLQ